MAEADGKRITPLEQSRLPTAVWSATVPIRFRHCDPAGIVFTPRYFDMLNEVVERFFIECLALDYYGLIGERRLGLGYARAGCDFLAPSRMGEVLEFAVLVERIGDASYTLLLPAMKHGREVLRGRLVTVSTTLPTMKPCRIPPDLRAALEGYRAGCGPSPVAS